MKIGKYNIQQQIIQNYLFAIKWNQLHGTNESDKDQQNAHNDVLEAAGFNRNNMTDEAINFSKLIDDLVHDLIIRGY